MECPDLLLPSSILAIFILFLIFMMRPKQKQRNDSSSTKEAPEPKGKWPVVGHLFQLGGKQTLARTLGAIADDYGPAFTLWLGQRRLFVVSSWEIAKECLTDNDKALASRPLLAAGKYVGYNHSFIGFAPYGNYWRDARKLATIHLLSGRQLELLEHIRVSEVNLSINRLYQLWEKNKCQPVKVDLKAWLQDLAFNNVVMMIARKRFYGEDAHKGTRKYRVLIEKLFYLMGVLVPSDAVPWLEWLDIGGVIGSMKEAHKEMDMMATEWIDEHRRRKTAAEVTGEEDLIDVMLSMMDSFPVSDCDPELAMKATILTLLLGASDSTNVTMSWALSLLLNNYQVLQKAYQEFDSVIGNGRNVDESDITNLHYFQAIIKETMRLYPAGPVGGPHQASVDLDIAGFHVPAGTQVIFNLWKIQRDPKVWENPLEFKPERFIDAHENLDFRGQSFHYIPFGAGRRMCPGITFAVTVMHLTLARLLHSFDIAVENDGTVDMTEGLGVSLPKATPLNVIISPRLPNNLY